MVICTDTSFLFALYGNDIHTPEALKWLVACETPVIISPLNEFELVNALRLAEFRQLITNEARSRFLAQFETDLESGRLTGQSSNFNEIITEAKRLSAIHTVTGGHRGFDILHVATARVQEAQTFLTFDANQKRLAETEGLAVPFF